MITWYTLIMKEQAHKKGRTHKWLKSHQKLAGTSLCGCWGFWLRYIWDETFMWKNCEISKILRSPISMRVKFPRFAGCVPTRAGHALPFRRGGFKRAPRWSHGRGVPKNDVFEPMTRFDAPPFQVHYWIAEQIIRLVEKSSRSIVISHRP